MMDIAIAGAGAGKTTWLIERARSAGVDASRVLALTFSRAQGADLAARLSDALGGAPGYAGTLHGWALQLVERHAAAAGWRAGISVYGPEDEALVMEALARDLGYRKGTRWTVPGLGRALLRAVAGVDGETAPALEGQLGVAVRRLQDGSRARRRAANAATYDELISAAAVLVSGPAAGELRAGLDLVLVDEAQDLDGPQWTVIHALAALGLPMVVVGDPRQSIYGWRGAGPGPLLEAARATEAAGRLHRLGRCWRCAPPILAAADRLIASDPGAQVGGALEAAGPARGAVEVRRGPSAELLPVLAVDLDAAGFAPEDWAVLARTNAQVDRYRQIQRAAGVPVAAPRPVPVLLDLPAAALRLAANEADEAAYLALARAERWDARLRAKHRAAGAAAGSGPWAGARAECGALGACGPESTAGEVLAALAAGRMDAASARADLANLLSVEALGWPAGRAAAALADARRVPAERAAGGVEVLTIHAAKGREWPAVIVPGWIEGGLPHRGADVAEERRVAYVAMTRARERLVLIYRDRDEIGGAGPSRFLRDAGFEIEE